MVFVAPRDLFRSFRADAPWLDALLLSTIVAVVTVLALPDELFIAPAEEAVNRRGEPVTLTSSPAEIARFGRYLGMLGTAIAHPLLALGIAGVLALLFSVVGGGAASYRQYLAVTSHALLISALGALVAALLGLFSPGLDSVISPAALLPADATGWLHDVLASLDLFTLWMLAVLALGVSQVDRRRSWPAAAAVLFSLSLALLAARAALLR